MSRVGKAPIPVPGGVTVDIGETGISVTGPKGSLSRSVPGEISIRQDGDTLVVERANDERTARSLHGLMRTLVNNMVVGVSNGYARELDIIGVGYRAAAQGGTRLELALGFSHPVHVDAPAGVTFETPTPTKIIIRGIDKELVGQVAANIRKIRKPEPYKGKGIRYAGENVLRKAGKASKK